jgi:hypothetical protein
MALSSGQAWGILSREPLGSFRIQSVAHHFLAKSEGRYLIETSLSSLRKSCVFGGWGSEKYSKLFPLYLPCQSIVKAGPSPVLSNWALFFHGHHHCLGGNLLASSIDCRSAFLLPSSYPVCILMNLSKIPLESCHPWAHILQQPTHCLRERIQALVGCPRPPTAWCLLVLEIHSHQSLTQEPTQGLPSVADAPLQTPHTYLPTYAPSTTFLKCHQLQEAFWDPQTNTFSQSLLVGTWQCNTMVKAVLLCR